MHIENSKNLYLEDSDLTGKKVVSCGQNLQTSLMVAVKIANPLYITYWSILIQNNLGVF